MQRGIKTMVRNYFLTESNGHIQLYCNDIDEICGEYPTVLKYVEYDFITGDVKFCLRSSKSPHLCYDLLKTIYQDYLNQGLPGFEGIFVSETTGFFGAYRTQVNSAVDGQYARVMSQLGRFRSA